MTVIEMLNTDIKHCRLDEAERLCEALPEETWNYVHEDEDMDDDFRFTALDCQPDELTETEYLWHNHWDEFIDFLREKFA